MSFDSVLGGESKKYISSNVQGLNPEVIPLKNILKTLSIPRGNVELKKRIKLLCEKFFIEKDGKTSC